MPCTNSKLCLSHWKVKTCPIKRLITQAGKIVDGFKEHYCVYPQLVKVKSNV